MIENLEQKIIVQTRKKGQRAPTRLVGRFGNSAKKVPKIGDFFADNNLGFSIRLNHAGVTGADWRYVP